MHVHGTQGMSVTLTDSSLILHYGRRRERTIPLSKVASVNLSHPSFLSPGFFQVDTGSHDVFLKALTNRVPFSRKQVAQFEALASRLSARIA